MSIPVAAVLNRWAHTFEELSFSAAEFYTNLGDRLLKQEMPDTQIGTVTHKQAGVFSASRQYLRVKHRDLVFDICAAPFGRSFFISWWLYETEGPMRNLFKNSKIGNILQARAARRTFFQMDLEQMFKDCVHDCVIQSITTISEAKGIRQLTDAEKEYKSGGF